MIVGRPCIVVSKPTALNFLILVSVQTNHFLKYYSVCLLKMSPVTMKKKVVFVISMHTCDVGVCYILGKNYVVHVTETNPGIRAPVLTSCPSLQLADFI